MREVKYRAWYDGEMYEVAKLDLWGDPDQTTCELASLDFDEEELFDIYLHEVTLMQSTGLKDKNCVEIYEGDIINTTYPDCNAVVKWDSSRFLGRTIEKESGLIYVDRVDKNNVSAVEVIGNIYENPELLEGGE